jgi:hypothetical protein
MKNSLSLILLLATTTLACAQGKVSFAADTGHLVYFATDTTLLATGDAAVAGKGLYAATIGSLTGAPTLVADLWAGTSATSLSKQTTAPSWSSNAEGRWTTTSVLLPNGMPGGQTAYFQVQIHDARDADASASMNARHYYGTSPIFSMIPGVTIYVQLGNTTVGASTWPTGTFPMGTLGFGAIQVHAAGCLGPYWIGFTTEPTNQAVVAGASAAFYVGARACPPPYYQWYFNGLSIPGATDCTLAGWYGSISYSAFQIANAQLTNAGTYYAVLSNAAWSSQWGVVHTSASATLTVLVKPTITSPPQSQTADLGSTVGFYVNATNTLPLSYQWFFNSTIAITGSTTNCTLLLTNVQPSQAGAYTVVVRNIAGAATSSPAMLSVIPPVERRPVPGVKVTGEAGSSLNVDYAGALSPAPNWTPLGSVSLAGTSQYCFDLTVPLPPQRYYQAWQTGTPGVVPSLDLHLVPAITLTGNLGDSLRLDYINRFGPTDAWVTLDTVTLSNTSQLYFDVFAWGQPQRLYRLVPLP